ncbi:hypothetical protein PD885_01603 [Xanthomonas fragariae]|uniref:Transposase n=1 Tax=Xanthomonas fragariae TaxID=48664 RepID=A0ABY1RNI6_9XANT|nr:hypothetical protein PD885_01603 [Xanthomonas fragariae]
MGISSMLRRTMQSGGWQHALCPTINCSQSTQHGLQWTLLSAPVSDNKLLPVQGLCHRRDCGDCQPKLVRQAHPFEVSLQALKSGVVNVSDGLTV